eukprot:SAG31_NODE_195_length_20708_cov_9.627638_10_plen_69_part_00
MFFTAIESDSAEAAERLQEALQALGREDPSLTVGIDQTTGQLLVHGMGELHLEVGKSPAHSDVVVRWL